MRIATLIAVCLLMAGTVRSHARGQGHALSVSAYAERIQSALDQNDPSTALAQSVDALLFYPQGGDLCALRGLAHYQLGHYWQASYDLLRGCAARPHALDLRYALGWSLYNTGRYDESADVFRFILQRLPGESEAATGLGWALLRRGQTPEAATVFRQAQDLAPQNASSRTGLFLAETGRWPDAPLTTHSPRKGYIHLTPYFTQITYGGEIPKTLGRSTELIARAGLYGVGNIELDIARTDIERAFELSDVHEWNYRVGIGAFINRDTLLRARFSIIDPGVDSDQPQGRRSITNTYVAGIGLSHRISPAFSTGINLLYTDSPLRDSWQASPSLMFQTKEMTSVTTLDVQHAPGEDKDDTHYFVQQELYRRIDDTQSAGVWWGGGKMRYGSRGLGDIVFSVPHDRTHTAGLAYYKNIAPFQVALKTSYDAYDIQSTDLDYHAVAHTISVGYLSDAPLLQRTTPSRLSVSAGALFHTSDIRISLPTPSPLVESTVAPIALGALGTFSPAKSPMLYDDAAVFTTPAWNRNGEGLAAFIVTDLAQISAPTTRPYGEARFSTDVYSYDIENSAASISDDQSDEHISPYVRFAYALTEAPDRRAHLSLVGQYGVSHLEQDTGWRDILRQQIVERITRNTFAYETFIEPFNGLPWAIFDADTFNAAGPGPTAARAPRRSQRTQGQRVFSEYQAQSRGEFDMDVYDWALLLAWQRALGSAVAVSVGAGPHLALLDWSYTQSTRWTEVGDAEILQFESATHHGTDVALGARGEARFAVERPSGLFVELFGSYRWYDDIHVQPGDGARIDLDLTSYSAGLGMGVR